MNIEKEIYHLHHHIVILGYNERVVRIVKELNGEGIQGEENPILIVAQIDDCPAASTSQSVHFLPAGPSKEDTLKKLKLDQAQVVLVVADQSEISGGDQTGSIDAQTVLTVITLNRYFSLYLTEKEDKPRVIAECMEENTLAHLKNAGCDEIIMIGTTSASLLAASVINPGITKFFGEVFSTLFGHEFYIVESPAEIIGFSFLQALKWMKVRYGDILIAIKQGHHISVNPRRFVIQEGDLIVVLSRHKPNYKVRAGEKGLL